MCGVGAYAVAVLTPMNVKLELLCVRVLGPCDIFVMERRPLVPAYDGQWTIAISG